MGRAKRPCLLSFGNEDTPRTKGERCSGVFGASREVETWFFFTVGRRGLGRGLEGLDARDERLEIPLDVGAERERAVARLRALDDPAHPTHEVDELGELVIAEVPPAAAHAHATAAVELQEVDLCGGDLRAPRGEMAGCHPFLIDSLQEAPMESIDPRDDRGGRSDLVSAQEAYSFVDEPEGVDPLEEQAWE